MANAVTAGVEVNVFDVIEIDMFGVSEVIVVDMFGLELKEADSGDLGFVVVDIFEVIVVNLVEAGVEVDGVQTVPPKANLVMQIEFLKVRNRVLNFLDRISSGGFLG